MGYSRVLRPCVFVFLSCAIAAPQAVISTHSGTVNFSEGNVFLDDQAVNQKAATFPSVKNGSTFRTEEGRAEILLEPSVFLRIDENSAVKMISDALSNTQIEFVKGALILDSSDRTAGSSLVLSYKSYRFRFPKPGVYRINAEPGILETYSGEAEVSIDGQPAPKKVDNGHEFFFDIGMLTPKYGDGTMDSFSEWARQRSETIAAANRAAQGITDPADSSNDPGYDVGPGLPGLNPGYGSVDPGYGTINPGYGPATGPIVVPPVPSYGAYSLYSSTWGTPFLLPTLIAVPVYYRGYPIPNRWQRRSVYPGSSTRSVYPGVSTPAGMGLGLTRSPALGGVGLPHSPSLIMPRTTPRVGISSPRVTVATPHYAAPHFSAPAAPHVMIHR